MKLDVPLLIGIAFFGIFLKKISWKNWYMLVLVIVCWMAYNVRR